MQNLLESLFPNGLGTRAILSMVVVGGAVGAAIYAGATDKLMDLATIVMGWYFVQKLAKGKDNETVGRQ